MTADFVHLHCHTDYSLLDATARIEPLVRAAAQQGAPALAITDHGNLFGAYEFQETARRHGIKPIIGMEAYLTPGTPRGVREMVELGDPAIPDGSVRVAYTHLTLWSQSQTGLHNLFKLSTRSSVEGHFIRPRIDRELFAECADGLIATTGCPAGEVQTYLRLGRYDQALATAGELREIVGPQNFYVELMDHAIDLERAVRDDLLRLARQLDAPLVATNDVHYVAAADASTHDLWLCVATKARVSDPNRESFCSGEYSMKPPAMMRELFGDLPEACDSTLEIAERCQSSLEAAPGSRHPRFPVPDGHSEVSWLRREAEQGLRRRFGDSLPDSVRQRAEHELGMIAELGHSGVFLVVADYVGWIRRHQIRIGPGRAQAPSSLIAYALGITEIDPIAHGLPFERFVNPRWPAIPDFDIEIDERHRDEVLDYLAQRYGPDHMAQISIIGRIGPKAAITASAVALETPPLTRQALVAALPKSRFGERIWLQQVFDEQSESYADAARFRDVYRRDRHARRVVHAAEGIERLKQPWFPHECGIMLSSEPIVQVVPLMRHPNYHRLLTQFDYATCEALGLLKCDILGWRELSTIELVVEAIEQEGGGRIDMDALPLDDTATWELLAAGETEGIFGFSEQPSRALLRRLRPARLIELATLMALARPGPVDQGLLDLYIEAKNERAEVPPWHPELAPVLAEVYAETHGVPAFQEQIIHLIARLAGLQLDKADVLRRLCYRTASPRLAELRDEFTAGMAARGYSTEAIEVAWAQHRRYSLIGLPKAHLLGHGLVAYQMAWLKANHPIQFAAVLAEEEAR